MVTGTQDSCPQILPTKGKENGARGKENGSRVPNRYIFFPLLRFTVYHAKGTPGHPSITGLFHNKIYETVVAATVITPLRKKKIGAISQVKQSRNPIARVAIQAVRKNILHGIARNTDKHGP
jgi:hypothetical protein